jgi:hypothetical protein
VRHMCADRTLYVPIISGASAALCSEFDIVTHLINALPGNGSVNTVQHATIEQGVMQPVSRQRLCKHTSAQVQ